MKTRFTPLVLAACAALALAACGDDDKPATTTPATSAATTPATSVTSSSADDSASGASSSSVEDYEIVPDAAVTTGFNAIKPMMSGLAAAPAAVTDETLDAVEASWKSFEGTVKKNEPATYLELEEALDAFFDAGKAKDGAAMSSAATDFATAADAYLAKHP